MWNKLPIKDRLDLMRVYKRNNYSYSDMVKDYNESVKKYAEGGETDPEPPIIVGGITDKIHDLPEVTIVDEKPKNMFAPKNWVTTYGAQPTSTPVNFVTPNYPKTEQEARTRLENEDRAKFESYLDQVDEYTKLGMSFDEAQDAAKRVNKQIDRPDVLREYIPKSLTEKTLQVAMNPVEAFKQYNKYGYVADNYNESDLFSPTGILDLGYQFLTTPGQIASVTNAGYNIPKDIAQGNYVSAIANSLDVLPGVSGAVLSELPSKTGKYLTTQTPLKNAYKYNPWAFKPNPEAAYRGIGKAGYDDLIQTGEVRSLKRNAYPEPYFAKGIEPGNYAQGYMIELNPNEPMKGVGAFTDYHNDLIGTPVNKITIDNPNLKILKKDWLRGYKQVDTPTTPKLPVKPQYSPTTSERESIKRFNENLDILNEIIARNNKTGIPYKATGIRGFDRKVLGLETLENSLGIKPGENLWTVDIKAASEYPGLSIINSGPGAFSDRNVRVGSGAYKSLNEYLNMLNLGTLQSSGKTTLSDEAKAVWNKYISEGKAFPLNDDIQQGVIMKALEQKFKKGGMIKRADGTYSRRGLWDNIRANRGSGKEPTPEMLKQEKKIRAKE